MKSLILSFSLLLIVNTKSFPQVSQEWVAIHTPGISRADALDLDENGNVIVTGYEGYNWLTIKYSAQGDTIWEQQFISPTNQPNNPRDIAVDRWGNAVVVGRAYDSLWYPRWFATKYDANDGHSHWEDMLENNYWAPSDDAFAVAVDTLGRAVVVGVIDESGPIGPQNDWIVKCYSPSGTTVWFERFDRDSTSDGATGLELTRDGIAYVCGLTRDETSTYHAVRVHKYNYYGPDWNKFITIYTDQPTVEIALDNDQNVFIVADEALWYQDYGNILIIKYDSSGAQLWERRYSTQNSFDDQVIDIATDSNGDLIIVCQFEDDSDLLHCQIVKYSANGDSLWAIDQGSGTWPTALVVDTDRNIYVNGKLDNGEVMKYDPDGKEMWSASYGGGMFSSDIELDGQNNIFICGQSGSDFITIKYSQQTSDIYDKSISYPTHFELFQNYPNPFNPSTKIKFTVSQSPLLGGDGRGGLVTLKVYDILGNEVATLVSEELSAGEYEVAFNAVGTSQGLSLSSGVYFYQLRAGSFIQTKKMILLR